MIHFCRCKHITKEKYHGELTMNIFIKLSSKYHLIPLIRRVL